MGYPSKEEIEYVKKKTGFDISPNAITVVMSFEGLREMEDAVRKARREFKQAQENKQKAEEQEASSSRKQTPTGYHSDYQIFSDCKKKENVDYLSDVDKAIILETYNNKIRAKSEKGIGWDNFLEGYKCALRLCGYKVCVDWVERGDWFGFDVKKIEM